MSQEPATHEGLRTFKVNQQQLREAQEQQAASRGVMNKFLARLYTIPDYREILSYEVSDQVDEEEIQRVMTSVVNIYSQVLAVTAEYVHEPEVKMILDDFGKKTTSLVSALHEIGAEQGEVLIVPSCSSCTSCNR